MGATPTDGNCDGRSDEGGGLGGTPRDNRRRLGDTTLISTRRGCLVGHCRGCCRRLSGGVGTE